MILGMTLDEGKTLKPYFGHKLLQAITDRSRDTSLDIDLRIAIAYEAGKLSGQGILFGCTLETLEEKLIVNSYGAAVDINPVTQRAYELIGEKTIDLPITDLDAQYTAELATMQEAIRKLQELHYRYASDAHRTPRKLVELRYATYSVTKQVQYRTGLMETVLAELVPAGGRDVQP